MPRKISLSRSVPLRTLLIGLGLAQVISSVGIVGYLSFRNGQRAVNYLASQLRSEVAARIDQKLRSYFETPHEINRLNASAFVQDIIDVTGASRGETLLYQQMKITPTLAYVYCASAQRGEYIGVARSPTDGSLQLGYSNQSTDFLIQDYGLDVRGERTFFLGESDRPYDARVRPWFQDAVMAQHPIWTDVYIAFSTGLPNITAAVPVYDRSGENLLGVCASDIALPEEFRSFLQQLEIGETGQAFVMSREGSIISNSIDEPLMVGDEDDARPILATESTDTLVRGTANFLISKFGNLSQINQPQQLIFDVNGERQFLEIVPFKDEFGVDWLIAVVVPEADFMAQINANTRQTIVLCTIALTVVTALAILIARWISQSVQALSQTAQALADGKLDSQVNPQSISELRMLGKSFNRMSSQLQASFKALRQSEATNRAIVTNIPDLLIRAKGDGTYLDVIGSDRPEGVHGVRQLSPGSTVQTSLPPDLAELRMHHIQKALETGEPQVYEQRLTLSEQPQDEEVRVLRLGEDEVLIMVRDITARKQNEKLREENLRLGAEIDVARQIQQMILPKDHELEQVKGLDIAGYMEPADEIGGDYYDVLQVDGIATIGIGDVTGHGLESGLLMLMTQTAVRTLQEMRERDPVRFLDTLNRTIYHNVQRMNSDRNLTLAILNYAEGKLSISGQHEETLVVRANGTLERIDTMDLGLPIGLDNDIADFISHTLVTLHPGDGVVLYTDGIPEAYNPDKRQYGMERLCDVIRQSWLGSAAEIKQAIVDDVQTFIDHQKVFDDITLLVLKQQ